MSHTIGYMNTDLDPVSCAQAAAKGTLQSLCWSAGTVLSERNVSGNRTS